MARPTKGERSQASDIRLTMQGHHSQLSKEHHKPHGDMRKWDVYPNEHR